MKLGKIGGVSFRLNSFLLLIVIVYCCLGLGREIIAILSAVLIHEIAHTVVALMLDIRIREIELLPFGGQATIEDFTGLEPDKEIYMALAGPFISLSLAALFYFLGQKTFGWHTDFFINVNLALGLFNLLPALPLDGGRILRGLLSQVVGYRKSTRLTAFAGQLIALAMCLYGIYQAGTNLSGANYIVIGFFLFWSAHQEGKLLAYSFMRFLVKKKGELSTNGFLPCTQIVGRADVPVKDILKSTRPGSYLMVVIVDDKHRVMGIKTEAELIEGFLEKGPRARVWDC
ncbi:MAG: M50 family metallopeptidase [Syntrophomonas sp.]